MITVRRSAERGHADHGWLKSFHTFSFADYYDERHMHFGPLRVINEDWVQPGKGFGTHPHRDMEIITYILEGELEHKDSMGTGSIIRPGDVQKMSAGSGVTHSEFNPSPKNLVHLLQIWIIPDKQGITPRYEQKTFSPEEKRNRLLLVASQDGSSISSGKGVVTIEQDAHLYAGLMDKNFVLDRNLDQGRLYWLQIARGRIEVDGKEYGAGDALGLEQESALRLKSLEQDTELLFFDLAG